MHGEFELSPFFDLGATFVWAVSGAGLGVRYGYDYTGIFVMALVSATRRALTWSVDTAFPSSGKAAGETSSNPSIHHLTVCMSRMLLKLMA